MHEHGVRPSWLVARDPPQAANMLWLMEVRVCHG